MNNHQRLQKLQGQMVNEYGILFNLMEVGIMEEDIDRIHYKNIYTSNDLVGTQFFIQLQDDEYILFVTVSNEISFN